jgi:hypothetical protein
VRRRLLLGILCASLAPGCDPVPDLYVVDSSADAGATEAGGDDGAAVDAADAGDGAVEGGAGDAAPEACVGLSCPECPPNPGACCSNGVPCVGLNCGVDCAAGCASCVAGEMCCSKQGGPAMCRELDGGKCPP